MNFRKLYANGYNHGNAIEIETVSWSKLIKAITKAEKKSQKLLDENKDGIIFDGLYIKMFSDNSGSVYVDLWPPTSGEKDVLILSFNKVVFDNDNSSVG